MEDAKPLTEDEPFTGRKVRAAMGRLSHEAARLVRAEHSQSNDDAVQAQVDSGRSMAGSMDSLAAEVKRRDAEIAELREEVERLKAERKQAGKAVWVESAENDRLAARVAELEAKSLTGEELAEYEQGAEEIAVGTAIGRWSDNDLARLLATIRARDAEIALLNERCQVYADQWGEDAGRDSDTIAELRAEVERLRESESAMRERMEWTVDDNAKQRVKVSDLTARVAELESEKAAYGVHASRLERKNAELRELCGEAADFMRDNLETAPKGLYTRLRAAKEGKDV